MTESELMKKLCTFAYVSSILGICTLGICPAFALMAIAVAAVMKIKKVHIGEKERRRLKISTILSVISCVLFVVDIIIACVFLL